MNKNKGGGEKYAIPEKQKTERKIRFEISSPKTCLENQKWEKNLISLNFLRPKFLLPHNTKEQLEQRREFSLTFLPHTFPKK